MWMEVSGGICWTHKWDLGTYKVDFVTSWVFKGLLSEVNCYFHEIHLFFYCVGVGTSWFWPGCARVADKEAAVPQSSSTQWTGHQSSSIKPWWSSLSWWGCCKTPCEGRGQTQNRWYVGRRQRWASGETRRWTHWGTATRMYSGACWQRSGDVSCMHNGVH